jgi:hypothetical protein
VDFGWARKNKTLGFFARNPAEESVVSRTINASQIA